MDNDPWDKAPDEVDIGAISVRHARIYQGNVTDVNMRLYATAMEDLHFRLGLLLEKAKNLPYHYMIQQFGNDNEEVVNEHKNVYFTFLNQQLTETLPNGKKRKLESLIAPNPPELQDRHYVFDGPYLSTYRSFRDFQNVIQTDSMGHFAQNIEIFLTPSGGYRFGCDHRLKPSAFFYNVSSLSEMMSTIDQLFPYTCMASFSTDQQLKFEDLVRHMDRFQQDGNQESGQVLKPIALKILYILMRVCKKANISLDVLVGNIFPALLGERYVTLI